MDETPREQLHIYRGTGNQKRVWMHPCPNCNSLTYLGVFIPTVSILISEYHSPSYRCHNVACDPKYEEIKLPSGRIVYDLIDYGAYWDGEDKYYYTPQSPRM